MIKLNGEKYHNECVVSKLKYIINQTGYLSKKLYGIDIFKDNTVIKSVTSITDNYGDIMKLADMCNELKVELCHFDYILEDYFTDYRL